MKVIKSHRIVFIDVDDTLVIWDWKDISPDGIGLITVSDPVSGFTQQLLPHERHINLLKQFKARGHTVVVWSQGGYSWADTVVKALGLEELVDVVMSKPDWYIDDIPAAAFMGKNVCLHPTDPTKDHGRYGHEEDDNKYVVASVPPATPVIPDDETPQS